jgi:beta-glucosidase
VDLGILAGQDLEMPGPAKWRTEYLVDHCLMSRKITERQIDARVEKILDWAQKLARLSPDVVYGDDVEVTNHDSQDQAFLRELAGSSMVLLKNKGNVLPITNKRARVAVIGPGATSKCVSGGGSAALNASYVVTVLDGLRAGAPSDLDLEYCLGTPGGSLSLRRNLKLTLILSA